MHPQTRDKLLDWIARNPDRDRAQIAAGVGMAEGTLSRLLAALTRCRSIHVSGTVARECGSGRPRNIYRAGADPRPQPKRIKKVPKPATPRKAPIPRRLSNSLSQLPASPFGIMIAQLQKKG